MTFSNELADDEVPDGAFIPYSYLKPNMLIQEGTQVRIDGLQSEKGKQLNGKVGTAIKFFPYVGRWSVTVPLKDSDGNEEYMISLKNLTSLIPQQGNSFEVAVQVKGSPGWAEVTANGRVMVRAGTTKSGKPCLLIADSPNNPDFDKDRLYEECSWMGVPKQLIESFVNSVAPSQNAE